MKKFTYLIISLLLGTQVLTSCDKDLEQTNDVATNFNILWSIIDQKYCFFPLKKDSIMDWDKAHDVYLEKANKCKTSEEVFYVFGEMLNELKDGHVNLVSPFDIIRYDTQGERPDNFVSNVIYSDNYLGRDYRRAGGLSYKRLKEGSIGYIYYSSFSNSISANNINEVLLHFKDTKGLIIDIRGNGGGMVTNVDELASHFTDKKILTGYYQRKTGPAHDAFAEAEAMYLSPSNGIRYLRPVVVLTNRDVFSAANKFAQVMQPLPHVLLLGDKTGGGAGMPAGDELPCGWTVRYSSAIELDANKNCTEWGIEPDIHCTLDMEQAYLNNKDSYIETAIGLIFEATE